MSRKPQIDSTRNFKGLEDLDLARQGEQIAVFGVPRSDPGFVYLLRSGQHYKIGRSCSPAQRMKQARTWNPTIRVLAVKPFWQHRAVEFCLHLGMAGAWKRLEWFKMPDEGYKETLNELMAFDDADIDRNSINFIYYMNGSGMSEFVSEYYSDKGTKLAFLKENSFFK